jgi:uncharacterized membrane protein
LVQRPALCDVELPFAETKAVRLITILLACLLAATVAVAAVAYSVVNVRPGDVLNMRAQPNPSAPVVATIPHNGAGILLTGRRGAGDWVEVTYQRRRGWVNAQFLGLASGRYEIPAFLDCAGTEPFWSSRLRPGYADADLMFTERRYRFRISRFQQAMNRTDISHLRGVARGANMSLIIRHESCSDGMSDNTYPFSAVALISGVNTIAGCCRPAVAR